MNIVVLIKQVPSTETKVRINSETHRVDTGEVEWVINPYDEYALEMALRTREKLGQGDVTLISAGPERVKTSLRTGLAMGADAAVHVLDPALEGVDLLSLGRVLAAAVARQPFDLVLCGKQAIDDDMAVIPQTVAHFLKIPHVAVVPEIEVTAGSQELVAHREIEGATEVVHLSMPCLISVQKGKHEPRYPTLKLMMAAKKKEISVLGMSELGIDPAGLTRRLEFVEDTLPPGRKPGRRLEGEPAEVVPELVRLLREEAKVI